MNTVYKQTFSTQISTHPRATKQGASSVDITVPFQKSQHREQSRRRADRKKKINKTVPICLTKWLGESIEK